MTPKLSVIIPVYNTEKYIKECVDSIINQTFKDYEIILVDDASTDGSGRICNEYAAKYDFIKVIHKEHGGPTHTRKAGLKEARGAYVSYIDSDDYIEPQMYDFLMDKLLKYDADIAICNILIKTENSRIPLYLDFEEGFYNKEKLKRDIYPNMLFSPMKNMPGIHPSLCNKVIRRSILENAITDITDEIYFGEDGICTYPCMLDAKSVYITYDKFFYIYRQTGASISQKYDKRLLRKLPILISVFDTEFEKRNYDGRSQINCYAALQLIFSIRNELLYNKNKTLREKVKNLKEYISQPRFQEVLKTIRYENISKQVKYKIFLLRIKWIYLLYLQFYFKEKILLLKEKRNERPTA